jgi:NADPH:quinone reductase-like Zn-dependent oxidoreductase
MSNDMKAVLLDKPGPPSSLRIGEADIPVPGREEALVRVYATSLNPVDYKVARQGYDLWRYPHILGVDVAGVIEAVGEGVKNWKVGDKVFYHTTWRRPGSYAEFNVASAYTFAAIPSGISFEQAAELPVAGLTAYSALYRRLHISEGDIALVHAAAGGVGGFAVQLAKAAKAFVIGTCSGHNKDYVKGLGADEVIDYRSENVFKRVNEIVGERGVDAIVDTVGPSNGVDNLRLLGPEGGVAFIAGFPDLSGVPDLPYSISIHDIGLGGVLASPAFRRRQEDLGKMAVELMKLVEEKKVRSIATEEITLEEIPRALERLSRGHVRGKIVVKIQD